MTVHEYPDDDEHVLRLRRAAEALPREVPPARDPWPGIKARIDAARVVPMTGALRSPVPLASRRLWLIGAAAVLIVASSAVTSVVLRTRNPVPPAVAGGAAPAAVARLAGNRGALVAEVFSRYDAAARDLEAVLRTRRDRLSPATQRVLEESLGAIDQAIGEARAALERDPASADMLGLLDSVYRQKLDLLRRANALPLRSS